MLSTRVRNSLQARLDMTTVLGWACFYSKLPDVYAEIYV